MNAEERKREFKRRTKEFAGSIVRFYISLDKRREELRIPGKQLIRFDTSVAAKYREASRARSDAEFIAKIELCAFEADEAQLWLELLRDDCNIDPNSTEPIWKEADELISIFVTMSKNTKNK